MDIDTYRTDDLPTVVRIWREVGWLEPDDDDVGATAIVEAVFADATARVARIGGEAESVATVHGGVVRYDDLDLSLAAVTSVTTSLVGRKRGLAQAVTSSALVEAARGGAAVAMLGMFEQGFYDRLGFGTGGYEVVCRFDPAHLRVPIPERTPARFTVEDSAELHAALRSRRRQHGGVALDSEGMLQAELRWHDPLFALGYRDPNGEVGSFLWGEGKGEFGPYEVVGLAYRTPAELLELLGLLRSLGDQVRTVQLTEPPEIQMQDLIGHPGRQSTTTKGGEHWAGARADAWWQVRILDLHAAVAARRWRGDPVEFVLELHDPLAGSDGWQGLSGTYRVVLADNSTVERADAATTSAPTLRASVNAFSRLWFGVRPATSLAATDQLDGPADLLAQLDDAFRLPTPRTALDF